MARPDHAGDVGVERSCVTGIEPIGSVGAVARVGDTGAVAARIGDERVSTVGYRMVGA